MKICGITVFMFTSHGGGSPGCGWWTVSCCVPGYDADHIVTVLLESSQSVLCRGARHLYLGGGTSEPTGHLSEGVRDFVLVHHFPRRLCPGEADGGGI